MDKDIQQAGPSNLPEQSEAERKPADEVQQLSPNALKVAAADCLNSWIFYLQTLNHMCAAGLRLAQSLTNLSQMQNIPLALQCQNSWEEFSKSTTIASNSVKTHIANAMQDMSIGDTFTEIDAQRQQEHNQQIITENLLTFVNLQYQFSIAGCENFSSMAMCPLCQAAPSTSHNLDCSLAALQQCFISPFSRLCSQEMSSSQRSSPHLPPDRNTDSPKSEFPRQHSPHADTRGHSPHSEGIIRGQSPIQGFGDAPIRAPGPIETLRGPFPTPGQLHTMKSPFPGRGSRSPLQFPLFPLNCQRRWSEAAAVEVPGEHGESQMRRWSMPWDTSWSEGGQAAQRYLPSKLVVPSGASERSRSTTPEAMPPTQPPPTAPGTIPGGEGLAEAIQLLSCRPARCSIPQTSGHHYMPHWGETHEERMHRRMMYPGPPSQRGNWQSIDVPHASGMSVTEHYDIFPPVHPLTSRKSSSSTDSSSCLSIHSRSTTSSSERGSASEASGPESIRLHTSLYSMWSGSEHLPFIQLPESQEPQDDSDLDDPPTEKSGNVHFPKPT